ncbi:MAG: DUF29 domain-containing protein [Alphaproteobacteria bacterium]|nr:DUF29 domain-containing protein [Alphaproteobacteria bacterium]
MPQSDLYARDFYAWANQQAALLRAGDLLAADVENIAEEIESMGRSERRELVNRLVVLMLHLLKWRFQPGLRGNGWRLSIKEQRLRLASHMRDNPSLKSQLDGAVEEAYRLALIEAERETGLTSETFPAICGWSHEQMMDAEFWPESGSSTQ